MLRFPPAPDWEITKQKPLAVQGANKKKMNPATGGGANRKSAGIIFWVPA